MFPGGFAEYWAKLEYKKDLDQIVYSYVPATTTTEEIKKTLASGGYGLLALPIAKHFFDRYQYKWFEPYEDDFIAQFKTNTISVIAEVRRKEHLWAETFRDIKQYLKKLSLKTDTRTSQNYDKTSTQAGKTINQGNESSNWQDQKSGNVKNIPAFANVDLTSGLFGGFSRQQQLSTQSQEMGQGSRTNQRQNTTTKQNHSNKEYMRAAKDSNVSISTQDSYALADILKSRLLGNFEFTIIKLSDYYPLFNKLFLKLFGCSVVPIFDPETGRRKWVSQVEYEEIEAQESGAPIRPLEGNEWDESLPYLERLKIVLSKTEKEYKKLPDTSNRKPRIGKRLEIAEGCVKAYEKLQAGIELPTVAEFRARANGEREGYTKIVGYKNILAMVEKWLKGWEFAKRFNTPTPKQLMIALSGPPGLGKTYISQAIAKALGRRFHMIGMNGKKEASFIFGTDISNPGSEPGEIVKAIAKKEDVACVILFDELEKAGKDAKYAVGNPTDRTSNRNFKDDFFDFPTPCNECIFLVAINYPEQLPDFIRDRFRVIEVEPLGYRERLEVLRVVLRGELKGLDNAFRVIYHKSWEEVYNLFNQEELLKKALTWTFSIRGAKDNIEQSLVPTLKADFLESERGLPEDVVSYEWEFLSKEEIDKGDRDRGRLACPYALDETRRAEHRENCVCFRANLGKVEGWEEEMGE